MLNAHELMQNDYEFLVESKINFLLDRINVLNKYQIKEEVVDLRNMIWEIFNNPER